mmetsp:Transcript_8507/g.18954  ORF Transcript_8507/g.18954 Transcript_8507/m.18954 type:complete len:246 (-) Transcript_8507:826-1563(-)
MDQAVGRGDEDIGRCGITLRGVPSTHERLQADPDAHRESLDCNIGRDREVAFTAPFLHVDLQHFDGGVTQGCRSTIDITKGSKVVLKDTSSCHRPSTAVGPRVGILSAINVRSLVLSLPHEQRRRNGDDIAVGQTNDQYFLSGPSHTDDLAVVKRDEETFLLVEARVIHDSYHLISQRQRDVRGRSLGHRHEARGRVVATSILVVDTSKRDLLDHLPDVKLAERRPIAAVGHRHAHLQPAMRRNC